MHPRPTNGVFDYPNNLPKLIDACDRRLKGNILINGAFQVWQRGTSFASGGTVVFTADRWAFYRSGLVAGGTLSRQAGGNAQYCARLQRDNGNASTANVVLSQSFESADCIPYRSQYAILGFRARSGANFSAASALLNATITTGTGTDESVHATYTGGVIQTTLAQAITSSFVNYASTAVLLPANTSEIAVQFYFTPVGSAGAADYVEIEEVQLIHGEYVGEFPYRSIAEELVNCRRHCRVEDFRVPATTAVSERIGMRAVPTISGGGAGYTSTGTTKDALVHFQTTGGVQTLTLTADI